MTTEEGGLDLSPYRKVPFFFYNKIVPFVFPVINFIKTFNNDDPDDGIEILILYFQLATCLYLNRFKKKKDIFF